MDKNDLEVLKKNKNNIELQKLSEPIKEDLLTTENYWLNAGSDIINYIGEVKKAMFEAVKHKSLSNDEKIIDERLMFTPSGYFVIKQTTNKQVIYYTNKQYNLQPMSSESRRSVGSTMAKQVTKSILKNFASGLPSSIGSFIGSSILNMIFGSDSYSLEELIKEVTKVVKDETIKNTIAEEAGKIHRVLNYITKEYTYLKDNTDKKQLLAALYSKYDDLATSMLILEESRFCQKGLSTYILAANISLPLQLEMSMLYAEIKKSEPNATEIDKDPKRNVYRLIYNDNVRDYSLHVSDTIRNIIEKEKKANLKTLCGKDTYLMVKKGVPVFISEDDYYEQLSNENSWISDIIVSWLGTISEKYLVELVEPDEKNRVFDICKKYKRNYALLLHYPMHGELNQQFLFVPTGNSNGSYYIVSCSSGKALDVKHNSKEDNANVIQYSMNGGDNQRFIMEKNGDFLKLKVVHSGKTIAGKKSGKSYKDFMFVQVDSNKEKDYYCVFKLEKVK